MKANLWEEWDLWADLDRLESRLETADRAQEQEAKEDEEEDCRYHSADCCQAKGTAVV